MYSYFAYFEKRPAAVATSLLYFAYDNKYGYQSRDVFDLELCHHQMLSIHFFIKFKQLICSGCKSIYYFSFVQIFCRLF